MKYHALKKKAFLAAAVFTGTTLVIPSMCLAASDKDIQTYTDTDFAMDTVVSETLYTTGDDINSKLTSVLTDVEKIRSSPGNFPVIWSGYSKLPETLTELLIRRSGS